MKSVPLNFCDILDKCNGRGFCYNRGPGTNEFCLCDDGYSGDSCEISPLSSVAPPIESAQQVPSLSLISNATSSVAGIVDASFNSSTHHFADAPRYQTATVPSIYATIPANRTGYTMVFADATVTSDSFLPSSESVQLQARLLKYNVSGTYSSVNVETVTEVVQRNLTSSTRSVLSTVTAGTDKPYSDSDFGWAMVILAILIVFLLLIFGGLVFWLSKRNEKEGDEESLVGGGTLAADEEDGLTE